MVEGKTIPRIIAMLAWLYGTPFAQARVQDYQIVRLVTYTTDCQVNTLEATPSPKTSLRFFASCDNITFYPKGIEILCDDPDDDRSCHVLTPPQSFDQLHLLDQHK